MKSFNELLKQGLWVKKNCVRTFISISEPIRNFGTLRLFDFMTLFYFKLAALWFIFGIETLNEINICFQTHRFCP